MLAAAIFLMLVRVGVDHFSKPLPEKEIPFTNFKDVDSILIKTFSEYGIEPGWIKKSVSKKAKNDTIEYFKIQVPGDLPVPVLINGLSKKFSALDINVSSKEVEVNGKTVASLLNGKKVICRTEFNVDKLLLRKAANFGFILNGYYDLSESDRNRIVGIPEKFAAVLIPSPDCEKMKDRIIKSEKEYVVLLDDNITEPKYLMDDEFSEKRNRDAVTEIVKTFENAKLFLVDNNSKLYKSAVFNLISKEFAKRNLPLVKINKYKLLEESGDSDFHSILENICDKSTNGENKAFLVNAGDFYQLTNEIEEFRNKGYKIIPPSSFNFNL